MYHKAVEAYFKKEYEDCTRYTLEYLINYDDEVESLYFGGDSLFKIGAIKEDGTEIDFSVTDKEPSDLEGYLICNKQMCWKIVDGEKKEAGEFPDAVIEYLKGKGIKCIYPRPNSMMTSLTWHKIREKYSS